MPTGYPRNPRSQPGPTYDFAELAAKFPSLNRLAAPESPECEQAWVEALEEKDLVPEILRDVIKLAYAHTQPRKQGARRVPDQADVDMAAIFGQDWTDDPLHVVLPRLLAQRHKSTRAFAMEIRMNRRTFQRMLLDDANPDKHYASLGEIAAIAERLGKMPQFFREYREIHVLAAMQRLIVERPDVATAIYRTSLQVKKGLVTYDRKQSPFLLAERLTTRDVDRVQTPTC